nr:perlucin-like [Cherax quadricarinatus]
MRSLRLLLLALVVAMQDVSSVWPWCPDGWIHYESICVWVSSEKTVWWKAWDNCTALGSHLAFIETEAESNTLTGIFVALDIESVWIGLNDLNVEGSFVWADQEPVTYTNYFVGEPNRNGSGREERCVAIRKDYGYKWSDEYCFDERQFICRMDI